MDVVIAGVVFLIAYVLIATEWVDRTVAALLGGLIIIALGVIDQHDAFDIAAQDDAVKVIILAANGPHFSSGHDLRDAGQVDTVERFGLILSQDFANMTEVQKGMKSKGFRGARTNPLQESAISNFHRGLREILFGEHLA